MRVAWDFKMTGLLVPHNQVPGMDCINAELFLLGFVTGSPRSRCGQGWLLPRPRGRVRSRPLPLVACMGGPPWPWACGRITCLPSCSHAVLRGVCLQVPLVLLGLGPP